MEDILLGIISLGIIALGIFLILKPNLVADKLSRFYSNYPIVRYAPDKQLKSRNSYVITLGIVIIITGFVCLLSQLGKIFGG